MIRRAAFLLPAGLALLAGLDAGLLLLGLPAPVTTARLPLVHGMLMTLGFVGTVIALERAVALRRRWGFLSPVLLGLGGVTLLTGLPLGVGQGLLVAGTAALVALYIPLWRRTRDDSVVVQLLGAVLALGGALQWWGGASMPDVVPWLAAFIVTTIAGERLELARVAMLGTRAEGTIVALCVTIAAACVATTLWPTVGYPLLGAALLALCGWLAVHDVARRTVRSTGLVRYMAWSLLAAYAWLTVAGAIWLLGGRQPSGPGYDAVLHSLFLGFTISMIMAHAPVILPAVLRIRLPYHPAMYVPVVVLHTTLLVRVGVGDARGLSTVVQVGGVGNVVAILLFVATMITVGVRGRRREPATAGTAAPAPSLTPAVGPADTSGPSPRRDHDSLPTTTTEDALR